MKRKLFDKLIDWKNSKNKKPILLTGGRGVGKTYLVYDFAKAFYSNIIYLNFEREPKLIELFQKSNTSMKEILTKQYPVTDPFEPVLLILDEIWNVTDYDNLMNRVNEMKDSYDILAITSNSSSFSKSLQLNSFHLLSLYPLDFEEFLAAIGNEWYIEAIQAHFTFNKPLPEIVHNELLTFFENFLQTGGMPSVVNEYVSMNSVINVSEKHRILIDSYLSDLHRCCSDGTALKVSQVFSTITNQLIKENHKFQYTMIRKGATQALFEEALFHLKDTYYGSFCYKVRDDFFVEDQIVEHEENPFRAFPSFKLYMPDVGMLHSTIRLQNEGSSEQIRKGLIENYVAQSLVSNGYPLYFWESNSQAKVDFIIKKNSVFIPIEVRINNKTRSKNISVFKTKCSNMTDSIKISTKNFDYVNGVKYVPVYSVFCI